MSENPGDLVALVKKISMGSEPAMASLYDATVNRVYGMAMKVVLKPELAEEVVGDVYLQVWRQAGHYNADRATPIGWLLMMCRSRALDKLRREKSATKNQYQETEKQEGRQDIKDENIEMPLDTMMNKEISEQLSTALQLLNKNQRQAVALAFYRGMSHQQISDYIGEPLGTVKSNIRRAQGILRKALSKTDLHTGLQSDQPADTGHDLGHDLGKGGLYG